MLGMMSKTDRDAAFTRFMTEASPSLGRTAWLLTGDAARAQELVQAALVKTYSAWSKVRRDSAVAYARRVLIYQRTGTWRRRLAMSTRSIDPFQDQLADRLRESAHAAPVLHLDAASVIGQGARAIRRRRLRTGVGVIAAFPVPALSTIFGYREAVGDGGSVWLSSQADGARLVLMAEVDSRTSRGRSGSLCSSSRMHSIPGWIPPTRRPVI